MKKRAATSVIRNLFVLTLVLIFPYPAFGQKRVSVKTIAKLERTIVPIVCGYVDEYHAFQIVQVVGTGFFVDTNGRFLTDAHVVSSFSHIKTTHPCFGSIYIPNDGWSQKTFAPKFNFQWLIIQRCADDVTTDLAVCQLIENPFTSKRVRRKNIATVSFDTRTLPEGTPIAFTGFPLQYKAPISSVGHVGGFQIISLISVGFDYVVDKAAWPGASGSPLYLGNGKVIGIMRVAGENAASGISMARGASTIVNFLTKHPYAAHQTQGASNTPLEHPPI